MYRDPSLYFVDILVAVDKIKRYTKEIPDYEKFISNEIVLDAVVRELIIIGESINKLLKQNIIDEKYRKIVDFRNMIVHKYFGIDYEMVWNIVHNNIIELEKNILTFIKNNKYNISDAIEETIKDFEYQIETVKFLNKLKEEI